MTVATITLNSEPPPLALGRRLSDHIDGQSDDMLYMHPIPN